MRILTLATILTCILPMPAQALFVQSEIRDDTTHRFEVDLFFDSSTIETYTDSASNPIPDFKAIIVNGRHWAAFATLSVNNIISDAEPFGNETLSLEDVSFSHDRPPHGEPPIQHEFTAFTDFAILGQAGLPGPFSAYGGGDVDMHNGHLHFHMVEYHAESAQYPVRFDGRVTATLVAEHVALPLPGSATLLGGGFLVLAGWRRLASKV